MTPPTCPLGTAWCTAHEPVDMTVNYAECVRVVGTVVMDQGPMTSGFRVDPEDGVDQEVVSIVRQLEGDPPRIDVDWRIPLTSPVRGTGVHSFGPGCGQPQSRVTADNATIPESRPSHHRR